MYLFNLLLMVKEDGYKSHDIIEFRSFSFGLLNSEHIFVIALRRFLLRNEECKTKAVELPVKR